MSVGIKVSPDGYVNIGVGEWASLAAIQQAVLAAQNPGLHSIATSDQPKLHTVNCSKALAAELQRKLNERDERQFVSNNVQQALELPSTAPQVNASQTLHANAGEHLPLPSTAPMVQKQTVKQKQKQKVTSNEQEPLELPSTIRKRK